MLRDLAFIALAFAFFAFVVIVIAFFARKLTRWLLPSKSEWFVRLVGFFAPLIALLMLFLTTTLSLDVAISWTSANFDWTFNPPGSWATHPKERSLADGFYEGMVVAVALVSGVFAFFPRSKNDR
jgi:hypothetical protein